MLNRISRSVMVVLFLAVLLLAGTAVTPAQAAGEAAYLEDVVHSADIDHITRLIDDALTHLDGLRLEDHDIVYDALGRTNAALDLLYDSGATGDVFNTAERLLVSQHDLLQEVENATLTGNLADLSTVAPLLVDYAQARLAFERQTTLAHSSHLPLSSSHLGSSRLYDRGLLGSRFLGSSRLYDRGLLSSRFLGSSRLYDRGLLGSRYLGSSLLRNRSLLGSRYLSPSRSLSTLRHSRSSLRHLGTSSLTLRRSRFYDPLGSRSLLLGRYRYYR